MSSELMQRSGLNEASSTVAFQYILTVVVMQ